MTPRPNIPIEELTMNVFPCDRCGWMRPDCTCQPDTAAARAEVADRHAKAVALAIVNAPNAVMRAAASTFQVAA